MMHQMRISTIDVSSVMLSSKNMEIKNNDKTVFSVEKTKQGHSEVYFNEEIKITHVQKYFYWW
jgi:hypothetical protein